MNHCDFVNFPTVHIWTLFVVTVPVPTSLTLPTLRLAAPAEVTVWMTWCPSAS